MNRFLERVREVGLSPEHALALCELQLRLQRDVELRFLAKHACASLRALLGADGVTFVLSEGEQVYYAEEDATGQLWKGRRFPASACISGWAVLHRQAAVIEDIYADSRIPIDAYRPTFVKSLAMVPVGDRQQVAVGALGVYWSRHHRASEQELFVIEVVAHAVYSGILRCRAQEDLSRLRAEASRPRNDAQRDGNGLNEQVLSMIAHDLRNPLNAIVQIADTLALESRRPQWVERVRASAMHAAHLVDQLYAYSREQREGLQLTLDTTPLESVCRGVVEEIRLAHPKCEIRVEADAVAGHWDGRRLVDAISNLVRNAVEHGDPRRPITVAVRGGADEACVEVHNHGDPIASDRLATLFKPFVTASRPSARSGLGLGLFIARQIVTAHGGRIEVRSEPVHGTTFTIRLPVHASMLAAGD